MLKAFVYTFRGCFGVPGEIGTVRGTTLTLKDTVGPPKRVPLRRLSGPTGRGPQDAGRIRPLDAKNEEGFAIDYRMLNKATPRDEGGTGIEGTRGRGEGNTTRSTQGRAQKGGLEE